MLYQRRTKQRTLTRFSYAKLVFRLLPLLIILPALVELFGEFSGQNPHEAFRLSWIRCKSPYLWASLTISAFVILRYLKPVTDLYCIGRSHGKCHKESAEKVIHRINGLHAFVIGFSILGFMIGEIIGQYAEGRIALFRLSEKIYMMDAFSKGLLTGVILSFNLDNILFSAKKTALAMNPSTRLRRTSLFGNISLIIGTIVVYLLFQFANTAADMFDLGSSFYDAFRDTTGPRRFFNEAIKTPELVDSLKVLSLKLLFYFSLVLQLILQVKWMIRHPVDTIVNRLRQLNSDNVSAISSIDILTNDEFTDALKEINALIRKQQAELECSSNRLEMIVEQAADPILSFDGEGKILVFNPAARKFFGYAEAEAFATPLLSMIELPPAEKQSCDACGPTTALIEHLYGHESGIERFTGIHKDGHRMMFESNVSGAKSGDSVIYTAVLRDISRQMEIEATLTDARVAAENANRLKTEFLANMSHELRTPLNAVLGFTQLLENDQNLTGGQKEKLGIISRSGGHLLSLINDILDISKIEAGKFELHESVFSLRGFVEDIREMFSLRCKKAGLGLYVEFAGSVPERVRGDLGKLRQVLINLVGNAVKFTPEGGIGITVGPDGDLIRFSVTDSGKGIPADELELIMQPFRQSSLNDNEGGTGLGLAISSRYIQMMGGTLEVSSKVGEGSTFAFTVGLPATDEEIPGAKDEPVAIAVKKGSEVTALIVDDKELNRLVLKEMLETAGFVTIEAENGKAAIERALAEKPDLVFMDIKMPVMDGYEAVRLLKSDAATKAIPVFALTASAFTNDEKKILASGFDGFLAKPFKKSTLFALIRDKSGLELEYETGKSASAGTVPDPDAVDYREAARKLGEKGIGELCDFILINDFTAIHSLAGRIGDELPDLAALMAHYAGSYDEAAFAQIAERLKDAQAKEDVTV